MSVWVWQGCHTLLQIPILLFFKNLFFCSSVFPQQHVLMFFCLFKQQHVLMSSCLQNNNMFSCPHVFKTTTCSHVLMSSKQKHVLMSSCLFNNNMFSCSSVFSKTTCSHVLLSFKKTCSSVFPPKEPCSPSNPVFMSPKKKRLRATLPAVKP